MALKKSELYSSLWQSCDELRGGMDASQYKDYVLVLLFVKYVSDRFVGQPFAAITVPEGASFADMVALKGKTDIGDQVNKKILSPLAKANNLADMPDFNDPTKLGSGKEMQDRLTNLISIFENPALDFSRNRADGDDLLGDAYEYLMRHFATESGKSKGQFYTPAEVSRIIAQILGIRRAQATANITADDLRGSGPAVLPSLYTEPCVLLCAQGMRMLRTCLGTLLMTHPVAPVPAAPSRRATNVTLPDALLREAREMGINLSQACERGLAAEVAATRQQRWLDQNHGAMGAWNDHVAAHGLPLAAFRQF